MSRTTRKVLTFEVGYKKKRRWWEINDLDRGINRDTVLVETNESRAKNIKHNRMQPKLTPYMCLGDRNSFGDNKQPEHDFCNNPERKDLKKYRFRNGTGPGYRRSINSHKRSMKKRFRQKLKTDLRNQVEDINGD